MTAPTVSRACHKSDFGESEDCRAPSRTVDKPNLHIDIGHYVEVLVNANKELHVQRLSLNAMDRPLLAAGEPVTASWTSFVHPSMPGAGVAQWLLSAGPYTADSKRGACGALPSKIPPIATTQLHDQPRQQRYRTGAWAMRAVQRRTAHSAVEEFVGVKVLTDCMIGVMASGTSDGLVEMACHAFPRVQVQQNLRPFGRHPWGFSRGWRRFVRPLTLQASCSGC